MNAQDITTLIASITALIGSISGLVVLIVHIIKHQPIPDDNQVKTPAKPAIVDPAPPDWHKP